MSRFDYVQYDEQSCDDQGAFKIKCEALEQSIDTLDDGRWKSLAYTKLEECYMCIGKQIRDDQIKRTGFAPLQENRKDG